MTFKPSIHAVDREPGQIRCQRFAMNGPTYASNINEILATSENAKNHDFEQAKRQGKSYKIDASRLRLMHHHGVMWCIRVIKVAQPCPNPLNRL